MCEPPVLRSRTRTALLAPSQPTTDTPARVSEDKRPVVFSSSCIIDRALVWAPPPTGIDRCRPGGERKDVDSGLMQSTTTLLDPLGSVYDAEYVSGSRYFLLGTLGMVILHPR